MTKKIFSYALAMTIGLGTGAALSKNVSAKTPGVSTMAVNTDAAYRDGLFLGQRDAHQGRLRHVSAGRWSASADRAMFTSGYELGYVNSAR